MDVEGEMDVELSWKVPEVTSSSSLIRTRSYNLYSIYDVCITPDVFMINKMCSIYHFPV